MLHHPGDKSFLVSAGWVALAVELRSELLASRGLNLGDGLLGLELLELLSLTLPLLLFDLMMRSLESSHVCLSLRSLKPVSSVFLPQRDNAGRRILDFLKVL